MRANTTASLLVAVLLIPITESRAACHEPGHARWAVKSSVPTGADLSHPTHIALADLLTLGEPVPPVTKDDARYSKKRIPAFDNPLHLKEGDIVQTEGWLYLVATESNDCEYHIQIANDSLNGSPCTIVEVPKATAKSVPNAALRAKIKSVRNLVKANILNGKISKVLTKAIYVRVTGQLFYDDYHIGDAPRGKHGMKAANLWELHPLVAFEFASPPA